MSKEIGSDSVTSCAPDCVALFWLATLRLIVLQRGASTSHSSITTRLKTPNKTRPRARAKKKSAAPSAQTSDAARRPSGKLGLVVDRLERTAGATIEALVDATGWRKHSVHGALSRLRSAGFAIRLELTVGRKAYRLAPAEA